MSIIPNIYSDIYIYLADRYGDPPSSTIDQGMEIFHWMYIRGGCINACLEIWGDEWMLTIVDMVDAGVTIFTNDDDPEEVMDII